MGFYDYRCAISGLSLKASTAYLILIEKDDDSYRPITLPIYGTYDRLGTIDMIDEDENTRLIFNYFCEQLESRNLIVDRTDLDFEKFEEIEQILRATERSTTLDYDCITLNGKRWAHTLISPEIWEAITSQDSPLDEETPQALFQAIFQGSATAEGIYQDSIDTFHQTLTELKQICDFMKAWDIPWQLPIDTPGQHRSRDMKTFIQKAKATYSDSPEVMEGISNYEDDVWGFLEE